MTDRATVQVGDLFDIYLEDRHGIGWRRLPVRHVTDLTDGRLRLSFNRDHPQCPQALTLIDARTLHAVHDDEGCHPATPNCQPLHKEPQ